MPTSHLFAPRETVRYKSGLRRFHAGGPAKGYLSVGGLAVTTYQDPKPGSPLTFFEAGRNPTDGVVVNYYLKDKPEGELTLTFLDAAGNEIKSFKSEGTDDSGQRPAGDVGAHSGAPAPTADDEKKGDDHDKKEPKAPAEAGMNRFVWNMRYPDATPVPGAIFWAGSTDGPIAAPGRYRVRLTVGGETHEQPFAIVKDPRVAATQADLDAQFDLLLKIRDHLSRTHAGINQLRDIRAQVEGWEKRISGQGAGGRGQGTEDSTQRSALSPQSSALLEAAAALKKALGDVEEELIQHRAKALEDPLNFPIRLNNKLASLSGAVASADVAPTRQAYAVYDDLTTKIGQHLITLATIVETDVSEFNRRVRALDLPAITVPQG